MKSTFEACTYCLIVFNRYFAIRNIFSSNSQVFKNRSDYLVKRISHINSVYTLNKTQIAFRTKIFMFSRARQKGNLEIFVISPHCRPKSEINSASFYLDAYGNKNKPLICV